MRPLVEVVREEMREHPVICLVALVVIILIVGAVDNPADYILR